MAIGHSLRSWVGSVLDTFFPATCQVCGEPASVGNGSILCDACDGGWSEVGPGCPVCCDPGETLLCVQCERDAPAFDRARSVYLYEGTLKKAIRAMKYQQQTGLAGLLSQRLAAAFTRFFPDPFHAIVPVPMHWRRRLMRGYNHAEVLAAGVSAQSGIPVVQALMRTRLGPQQARLNATSRFQNAQHAFRVRSRPGSRLAGSAVLLVDDVLTSGATAEACAERLKAAGAARVEVFTLARTPSTRPGT